MDIITLNDGNKIPAVGYGVFEISDSDCEECVSTAISIGYRHIDTAQIYGNESGVGAAIRNCGIIRGELFITSKVWVTEYGYDKTLLSIERSLKKLKTDYIDLMLLHRPFFDYKSAWKALEKARGDGLVRSIGISNFNEKQTADILGIADIKPAVNQIEAHPYYVRGKLKSYLEKNGVAVEAWYPLGHGNKKLIGEKIFTELSQKYDKTPSQIILRWHLQTGNIVFPKTKSPEHMRENIEIFDFALTEEETERISALDRGRQLFSVPDWVQKLSVRMGR